MIKPDEKKLFQKIKEASAEKEFPYVRDIVKQIGMNEKRAYYLLCKWTDRGLFNYGCSPFAGWLTEEGKNES